MKRKLKKPILFETITMKIAGVDVYQFKLNQHRIEREVEFILNGERQIPEYILKEVKEDE